MRFPHFFIDRPIFATVLAILITIIGLIAGRQLPIAEYPDIAPPTVNIAATYPGASATVIAETVATPIEQEVNGVDDMLYINSQSTGDGRVSINVVFKPGTNIDQAQVLVQNRVSVAEPRLPEDVRRLGLVVRKASPDLMMVVHMVSPDDTRDQQYISNYATLFVKDRVARIDGPNAVQALFNMRQERILGAQPHGFGIRMIAVVIRTAHDQRQLRAEMSSQRRRHPVAQRAQHGAEDMPCDLPVGADIGHHLVQPDIRGLQRLVENVQTGGAHDVSPPSSGN